MCDDMISKMVGVQASAPAHTGRTVLGLEQANSYSDRMAATNLARSRELTVAESKRLNAKNPAQLAAKRPIDKLLAMR